MWLAPGQLIAPDDLWWETGEGKRYEFRLEGEDAGVLMEENGYPRAIVKATGWHFAKGDAKPVAMGELRIEFYRGQNHYRLYHTVTCAGDPWLDTRGVNFGKVEYNRIHLHDKRKDETTMITRLDC